MFKKQIFIPVLVYVIFTLAVVDSASIFAVFPPKKGEFMRCKKAGDVLESCIRIKTVSPVTTDCTTEKKENAVYYLVDKKIEYGVLNADNTITDSQCDFSELNKLNDKFSATKEASVISIIDFIQEFVNDYADAVYLAVIGFFATMFGFAKYLGCELKKTLSIPCVKKKKTNLTESNSINPAHHQQFVHIQRMPSNQHFMRTQPMDTSNAQEIQSISNHPYLTSTIAAENFHRYASAPDMTSHNANDTRLTSKRPLAESMIDLPEYGLEFQDRTNQPKRQARRSFFDSTRLEPINEITLAEVTQNTQRTNKHGCMCQKGDCRDNGNNCSCKRIKVPCTSSCHPNRQCNNSA